jgi:D-alanyl-D-alanine carboxypeptidase
VARPGESEHQLGTTVDLADGRLQYVLVEEFGDTPEGRWLVDHCHRFGFRLTYTPATAEALGIRPEPWHVRFLGRADGNP